MPLYPSKVLRARERASTPCFFVVFCLGFTFESFKELGGRHKCNVMKLFKLDEDNEMHMVDVPNSTCLFLAIDYVECSMLF